MTDFIKDIKRIRNRHYAADILVQNEGPLFVVFDSMVTAGPLDDRRAWAFDFCARRGLNVIGLMESDPYAWYRRPAFLEVLEAARREVAPRNFSRRIGYGGSMGGYAAGAFSAEFGCDTCILFNPISTFNRRLAPFETRYDQGARQDWTTGAFDAARAAASIQTVYIVADPLFDLDAEHVRRFQAESAAAQLFRIPGVGHRVAEHMKNMDMLRWFIDSVIDGPGPDAGTFSALARRRRGYLGYYQWLLSRENTHLSERAVQTISLHLALFLAQSGRGKYDSMRTFALATRDLLPKINMRLLPAVLEKLPDSPRAIELMRSLENGKF
ncbi:MAG: hypothetical protein IE922_00325 [Sphingomonadales bacterium]|nr:hypothetical protein [Sphingomonadales bacterium]